MATFCLPLMISLAYSPGRNIFAPWPQNFRAPGAKILRPGRENIVRAGPAGPQNSKFKIVSASRHPPTLFAGLAITE